MEKGIQPDTFLRYRVLDNMTWYFNFTGSGNSDPFYKNISGNGSPFDIVVYFGKYVNGSVLSHPAWVPISRAFNFSSGYYPSKFFVVTNTTVNNTTLSFIPKGYIYGERVNFAANTSALSKSIYWAEYSFPNFIAPYLGQDLDTHSHPSWVRDPEHEAEIIGTKLVTVPAGTFNCTGVLTGSQIMWINRDLPFPVKQEYVQPDVWNHTAKVYVNNYELIQIGQGVPTVPEFNAFYLMAALPIAFAVFFIRFVGKRSP